MTTLGGLPPSPGVMWPLALNLPQHAREGPRLSSGYDTGMFELSKKDLFDILEMIGDSPIDVEVRDELSSPNIFTGAAPAVVFSFKYFPEFWIAVATWYCEREHNVDLGRLPAWTPLDLAKSSSVVEDEIYNSAICFFGFKLVD